MGLYVQLWPVWLVVAVLMVNLLIALARVFKEAEVDGASNAVATITAVLLALASVINLVCCIVITLKGVW